VVLVEARVFLGCTWLAHVSSVGLLGQESARMRTRDSLKVRLQGERTVAGSDPRSPKGFWRDTRAKSGVAPGHKTFFPASALLVVFMVLFVSFQVLVWY
jgi:hypothetical protein